MRQGWTKSYGKTARFDRNAAGGRPEYLGSSRGKNAPAAVYKDFTLPLDPIQ
jgi:hypothetical protein